MTTVTSSVIHPELAAQRRYGEQFALQGQEFALVAAEAFVRGIRDIGYKSTATALDELIDNSIQAGSTRVDVVFGFGVKSSSKPDRIAVVDNGHGMDPTMIRAAVMWGGTHRENNRVGFGRYGYGLPSSCVSQGLSFAVYSKPDGGGLHRVQLDVEELGAGMYHTENGRVIVPEPEQTDLPTWLQLFVKEQGINEFMRSGTAVVIERLDRLSWSTTTSLERHLLQHFGVTYRNFISDIDLRVNGKRVEPVDPLFVTEGFKYFDLDEDRALQLEPLAFKVKDRNDRSEIGTVTVRFSQLPPTFARKDKSKEATSKNANPRFSIMKDHLGLIFLRAGRQIDVVTRNPWTQFQTYDRNWNVEINFSPALDEEFSITTSKQQIVVSERMWDLLKEKGVLRSIEQMRKDLTGARRQDKNKQDASDERPSEKVMAESEKFAESLPSLESMNRQVEGEKGIEEEAKRRARNDGVQTEDAKAELIAELQGHAYKVREESVPGGAFYRPEQLGGQFIIWLNTEHSFYSEIYSGPESSPHLRATLELLLFTLGEAELNAQGDKRLFYRTERQTIWTPKLSLLLELLNRQTGVDDDEAMKEEMAEQVIAS